MSDVFISYAHIDNPELDDGAMGWVSRFHQVLGKLLNFHLGKAAEVWRDPRLDGNDIFEEVILKALAEAKALVSVMSPRYVNSEWCVREVVEFCRRMEAAGALRVGDKSRLFKVLTMPVTLPEQVGGKPLPNELRAFINSQIGVEFFDRDPESGRVRMLREEFGAAFKERFFQKVDDVASMLAELLRQAAAPVVSAPAGRTVYLALTTHDLEPERERIERELVERGHVVLPDGPVPMVGPEFETAVRACLERCQFAVQLIGGRYGLVPEEATESVLELQNRLAAERASAAGFKRLVWTPRDVVAKDARQAAFLQRMATDAAAQRGAELVQDTIEKLRGLILDLLAPPKPAPVAAPAPLVAGGAAPPRVYLICDPADEGGAAPLEDFLFAQGVEVSRPQFDGSEAEIAEAHRFNLRVCDAALIYYGRPSRHWVDVKLQDLLQAPGYGRTAPFRASAVCVAPPDNRDKQRFRTLQAAVVRVGESFSPEPIQPFLEQLRSAAN